MVSDGFIATQMVLTLLAEIGFLWVNYKGRFRYRLFEHNPIARRTDKALGKVSLLLHPLLVFVVFIFVVALGSSILGLSFKESTAIILSGIFGGIFMNAASDHISVSTLEKHCIKCPNTADCQAFHESKCSIEARRRWGKAAELQRLRRESQKPKHKRTLGGV